MRWSLILSTFITVLSVLSFVSHALPIQPPSSVELERRGVSKKPVKAPGKSRRPAGSINLKAPSRIYRAAGILHQDAYKFHGNGEVKQEHIEPGHRFEYGSKRLKVPGTHADHVLELQMVKQHLDQQHHIQFQNLPVDVQHKIHGIINGPQNVALVPAHINISKGQLIKHAMKGNAIIRNPHRDEYVRLSYPTAQKTAEKVDKVLVKEVHGMKPGGQTLAAMLKATMHHANVPNLHP